MMNIKNFLDKAVEHVSHNDSGELSLGWRLRLWCLMNETFRSEYLVRKIALAHVVARETFPAWEAANMPPDLKQVPCELIDVSIKLCNEQITAEEAEVAQSLLFRKVDFSLGLLDEKGYGVAAAAAAYATINCALSKEDALYSERDVEHDGEDSLYEKSLKCDRLDDLTDDLLDWESWDTHRFASVVAAGVRLPTGNFDIDKSLLRQFWIRWLREKVPAVLGNMAFP